MGWMRKMLDQPWRVTIAAVGGLLVAILIVGLVGLLVNRNVERVTNEALRYDVQLEDEGDDLRAAVLDLRHYHRNIIMEGRTTIVISHDLSTAREATEVLVIDGGRAAEKGTHAELLARGGVYARLYELHAPVLQREEAVGS